jgi:hypothetical protein
MLGPHGVSRARGVSAKPMRRFVALFFDCCADLKVRFSPREKAYFDEIQVASMNAIVEFDIKMLNRFEEIAFCLP